MSQTFCTQCGSKLPETGNFCPECGAPVAPPAQLDAELVAQSAPSSAESSGGSRTLLYAIGGAAALVALLAVVYFAFLRPAASSGTASSALSDCGDEPCTVEAVTAAAQSDVPYPEIARISADEAHIRLMQGEAVMVDVRDRDSYTNMHVPGALSIPLDEIEVRMGELPRDAEIITYCT